MYDIKEDSKINVQVTLKAYFQNVISEFDYLKNGLPKDFTDKFNNIIINDKEFTVTYDSKSN